MSIELLSFSQGARRMSIAMGAVLLGALTACGLRGRGVTADIHAPAGGATTIQVLEQLGWRNFRIKEFPDEQALHNGFLGYGPLAHVFPSDQLNSWDDATDFATPQLVAMVLVDKTSVGLPDFPVVPETYAHINLNFGHSCVWVRHTGSVPETGWDASVVSAAPGPQPCPAPGAFTLRVHAKFDPVVNTHTDYPPIARWHEGGSLRRGIMPMIGVKCGAAWCMIGHPQTYPMPLPHYDHGETKQWRAYGWSDVQHLAEPLSLLEPNWHFTASIIPDENLETETFVEEKRAATIFVSDSIPLTSHYSRRWGMQKGKNELFLVRDSTKKTGWRGELHSSRGRVVAMKVEMHDHAPNRPPPVARFRWAHDEELWVRCDTGCCRVAPE